MAEGVFDPVVAGAAERDAVLGPIPSPASAPGVVNVVQADVFIQHSAVVLAVGRVALQGGDLRVGALRANDNAVRHAGLFGNASQ